MKKLRAVFDCYSDSISMPKIYRVKPNLFAAAFCLMKLLPAKYVLEKALKENRIKRNASIVVETSSGTYALGLAIICREQGLPFRIVSDAAVDQSLKNRLEMLGGTVEIVESSGESPQKKRLEAVYRFLRENTDAFWPQQYDNPEHIDAYSILADFLMEHVGDNFILVASVGSGSSSCGTIKQLRKYNPSIELVGVDTFGSVLFGLANGPRLIRGLGNSLLPKNLIHSYFDQIHWTSPSQAFLSTRKLYMQSAIFAGPTSGACYQVANWVVSRNPGKKVVFICPDEGYRYLDTVYSDHWMHAKDFLGHTLQEDPLSAGALRELNQSDLDWGCLQWGRRSLDDVKEKGS